MRLQIKSISSILQALPSFTFIRERFYCFQVSLEIGIIEVEGVFNGCRVDYINIIIKRSGPLSNAAYQSQRITTTGQFSDQYMGQFWQESG